MDQHIRAFAQLTLVKKHSGAQIRRVPSDAVCFTRSDSLSR